MGIRGWAPPAVDNSLCCKPATHGESREARDTSQTSPFHRISALKRLSVLQLPKSRWFHALGEADTKVQFQDSMMRLLLTV